MGGLQSKDPRVVAKRQALIDEVKRYASLHYEDGGWDVVVEAYDDAQIDEMLEGAQSLKGAVKKMRDVVSVYAERQAFARSEGYDRAHSEYAPPTHSSYGSALADVPDTCTGFVEWMAHQDAIEETGRCSVCGKTGKKRKKTEAPQPKVGCDWAGHASALEEAGWCPVCDEGELDDAFGRRNGIEV